MNITKRSALVAFHAARASAGIPKYLATGKTPHRSFRSFRQLTPLTGGRSNATASRLLEMVRRPTALGHPTGVLGDMSAERAVELAAEITRNGYHVFEERLPESVCDAIRSWALSAPCSPLPQPAGASGSVCFKDARHLAPRFDFDEKVLLARPDVQRLATDRTLHAVAQAYMNCDVVNDNVAIWWSTPHQGGPNSDAAQMFHYDMSRPKWLKFFIYLTDVDEASGPHTFVRGSHRDHPRSVRSDSRKSDEEIRAAYGAGEIVKLVGRAGTIFAEDTFGFHKGEQPQAGDRLVFQVKYSNTLYGGAYGTVPKGIIVDETARAEIRAFPRTYARFTSAL